MKKPNPTAWIQLANGERYNFLTPTDKALTLQVVAHALGNICRFTGHCSKFYSVAEHSVHVSRIVPKQHALAGLVHDAQECIVGDCNRPLKNELPGYKAIEDANWKVFARFFGVAYELPKEVKLADNQMLLAEYQQIMVRNPKNPWNATWLDGVYAAPVKVQCWSPTRARREFIKRFHEIVGK